MRTQFHIRGLNLPSQVRRELERSVARLQSRIPISDAAVVLDRQVDCTPRFRAFVQLAVPGPDIHAEARDHTLPAAWLKVTVALRRQIEQRKLRQEARFKHGRPLQRDRPTRAVAGSRG